ncbi:hypothetical protein [Staphylococcus hominis]|uniref:hypothetical protein n=1 Tax=Staphylococcus hominis TaxID=1290 RepID=UPI0015F9F13C|nr:hypothetical protein [Staphylococcus hominis]
MKVFTTYAKHLKTKAQPYSSEDITKDLINKLDELWQVVMDEEAFNDVQALPQLHAIVWGNKRGV